MKRPFVTLCIFLFTGFIAAYFLKYSIPIYYVLYSVMASFIIFLRYERGFAVVVWITIFILGAYLYGYSIQGDLLLETASNDIRMNAKIMKERLDKKGYFEYEIEILSLFDDKTSEIIKVNKKAQLKVYKHQSFDGTFRINDIIKINNARIIKVFGDIDDSNHKSYELFLKSKGIEYILETNAKDIGYSNGIHMQSIGLNHMSYKTKVYIEDFLDSTLDFENSDILKSIIFGNQGYLSREKLDVFSKTGTAHIMAVSGLHVGLIVLMVDQFLKFMRIGRNARLYFTIIILLLYAYMVYFPVSIVRAGSMYMLYVIAYFLHRRYDSINALFFIAFILMIYRPMTIFSISFQLSFIATLSILLLGPIFNTILGKKIGFIGTLLSVTVAAQIGTLPIMAYYFGQISVISIATNLLIIPLLLPLLSIAFISVLVGSLSFPIGSLINQIPNHLLNYINWISAKCAIIPYGSFEVGEVKMIYALGYYMLLVIIYFLFMKKESNPNKKSNSKEEGLVKMYEL